MGKLHGLDGGHHQVGQVDRDPLFAIFQLGMAGDGVDGDGLASLHRLEIRMEAMGQNTVLQQVNGRVFQGLAAIAAYDEGHFLRIRIKVQPDGGGKVGGKVALVAGAVDLPLFFGKPLQGKGRGLGIFHVAFCKGKNLCICEFHGAFLQSFLFGLL